MPPSKEEIQKIIKLHEEGRSQREIAKELGKSLGWINGVFKKLNISFERSQTQNATTQHRTWTRERRLWLNDQFIDIICDRIKKNPSVSDLKSLGVTYAIMVDKREILEPPTPLKIEDDGFISALESKAEEVFSNQDLIDAQSPPIYLDTTKPKTMADLNLVDSSITNTKS